ncbi:hypothetical protein V8F20_008392 [Naviculisporaceae sp. PSN 640]
MSTDYHPIFALLPRLSAECYYDTYQRLAFTTEIRKYKRSLGTNQFTLHCIAFIFFLSTPVQSTLSSLLLVGFITRPDGVHGVFSRKRPFFIFSFGGWRLIRKAHLIIIIIFFFFSSEALYHVNGRILRS